MIQHQQLSTQLSELLGPEWNTEAIALPYGPDYRFDIYTRLTITKDDLNPSGIVDKIKDRFRDSPFYKQVTNELHALLDARGATIRGLEKEVERLKVFENHYQIEMSLRHGPIVVPNDIK